MMAQIRPISRSSEKNPFLFWLLIAAIVLNGLTTVDDLWKTGQIAFVRFITKNSPVPDEYKAPEKRAEWNEERTMVFDALNTILILFPIAAALHALVVVTLVFLPRDSSVSRWIQTTVAGLASGFDLVVLTSVISWEGLVAIATFLAIWCDKLVSEADDADL